MWSTINHLRNKGFDRGWIGSVELPVPVISVGNIQAGGTGKTTLVIEIAKRAIGQGKKVLVLTRGYGSKVERENHILTPSYHLPVDRIGDEAQLIYDSVSGVHLGIGSNRIRSWIIAQKSNEYDLVILDDGFQHRKIKRDLDLVLLSSTEAGERIFRELDFSDVRRGDFFIWTKGERPPRFWNQLPQEKKAHIRFGIQTVPLDREYWAVTSIADSKDWIDGLKNQGVIIKKESFFGDHHAFSTSEMNQITQGAQSQGLSLIMTPKDAVKWQPLDSSAVLTYPEVKWIEGRENFEIFLSRFI